MIENLSVEVETCTDEGVSAVGTDSRLRAKRCKRGVCPDNGLVQAQQNGDVPVLVSHWSMYADLSRAREPVSVSTMITLHEDTYITEDGLALFTRRWVPVAPAKALVVIVHGYAEHGGRYEAFAQRLVDEGYEVACMDHRGHGKSPGAKGQLAPLREVVRDFDGFVDTCATENPEQPLLVFAHSMGGLAGGLWASNAYGNSSALAHTSLRGIVLSSGLLSLWMDIPLWGAKMLSWYGRLIPSLPIMPFETEALTQDQIIVRAYEADSLIYHGWIRMQTAMSFAEGMARFRRSREKIRLPLLICHGTADRLCDIRGSRRVYRDARTADKTYQEYAGGYHELFNEPFRETYYERLIAWMDAHVG